MRKLTLFVILVAMLMLPLCAYADLAANKIGNGYLTVTNPTSYDYNGAVSGLPGTGLDSTSEEIFCVSKEGAYLGVSTAYSFYKLDPMLTVSVYNSRYTNSTVTVSLERAAWIADNYKAYSNWNGGNYTLDQLKVEAQKAVWSVTYLNEGIYTNTSWGNGLAEKMFDDSKTATASIDYVTGNWAFARNPVDGATGKGAQDYLVQRTKTSTPEPASLILFGLGLLGLAGVRRRMKK